MATPTLACGFECLDLAHAWTGTATIDTVLFEPGGGGASAKCTSATGGRVAINRTRGGTVAVSRFYVYFTTLPSENVNIWTAEVAAGSIPRLNFQVANGSLQMGWGGAWGTAEAVTTGVWYRIDIKAVQAATKTIDWQVDGVTIGSQVTLVETASTWATEVFGFYAGIAVTAVMNIDHMLHSATSTDYPLGPGYVAGFQPMADGTHTATGTNIVKGVTATPVGAAITNATTDAVLWVWDTPISSTTSFWNQQTIATEYVEVQFPDIVVAPRSVEVIVVVSAASTAACTQKAVLYDGVTASDIYALATVGVSHPALKYNRAHYASPPTGGVWDTTKFNALRARWGYSTDATPDVYCNTIFLEAEFAPIATNTGRLYWRGGTEAIVPNASPATTVVLNVPPGTVDGDALIAVVVYDPVLNSTGQITNPAGWTQVVDATQGTSLSTRVLVRTASSEPASYTWSAVNAQGWDALMGTYGGGNSVLQDVAGTIVTRNTAPLNAGPPAPFPTIAPITDDAWHLAIATDANANEFFAAPAGYTFDDRVSNNGSITVFHKRVAAGTIANIWTTWIPGSTNWITASLALRPADVTTPPGPGKHPGMNVPGV